MKLCICADPENCTQPVPGQRCRKTEGHKSGDGLGARKWEIEGVLDAFKRGVFSEHFTIARLAELFSPPPERDSADDPGDWQCRDYGDGWITFPDRAAAEKYQEETGALMRYRRFYPPHNRVHSDPKCNHGVAAYLRCVDCERDMRDVAVEDEAAAQGLVELLLEASERLLHEDITRSEKQPHQQRTSE